MGENQIKIASYEAVPPYRYGTVYLYDVPVAELGDVDFEGQLSVFSETGPVQSSIIVVHPSQRLGARLDFNNITLESLLILSGNLTKDTMLLFSLLKTVLELKKAWGKLSILACIEEIKRRCSNGCIK